MVSLRDTKARASRNGRLPLFALLACTFVFVVQQRLFSSPSDSWAYSKTGAIGALIDCESSPLANQSFQLAYDQSYGFFDDISDANWKLAQVRARTRANHLYPDHMSQVGDPPEAHLWHATNYEPDFSCGQERRVGGLGDGPKWVCDPHRLKSKKDCLIYSVGSNGQYEFEEGIHAIVGNACEIHVFDPSPFEKQDMKEDLNAYYHQWGFKSSYEHTPEFGQDLKFKTMQETMKELGHEGRTIDIFKIDCEGCEKSSINDWLQVDVGQILVETHNVDGKSDDFFQAFQNAHFYMFHKEINLYTRGDCVEWAYIRLHPTFWNGTEIE